MSMIAITNECPVCGDELPTENFTMADVWKDNRKQRLFVCRHCANKARNKRGWSNPLDEFKAEKGRR